jgi:deoxyribonuclease V
MKSRNLHPWQLDYGEAAAVQRRLAAQVSLTGVPRTIRTIAGADVSYEKHGDTLFAAILVMDARNLDILGCASAVRKSEFPYIPGLLSFREAPALVEAAEKLTMTPDVLMADAQGIAHPRFLGLASHLGLLLDCPTIGCAKSRLVGEYEAVGPEEGDWSPLLLEGKKVGAVLRTKKGVKPVFVSPGHKMSLASATRIVLATTRDYRLPEPTRQAHLCVNRMRRGET